MSSKIKVLLIDDSPASLFGHGLNYPQVKNDSPHNQNFDGIEKFFEVKWLQSPTDIREYRNLSYEIEDRFSPVALGKHGFVPEIICFDYRLKPGMGNDLNIPKDTIPRVFPTYELIDFLNATDNTNRRITRQFSAKEDAKLREAIIIELKNQGIEPGFESINARMKKKFPERFVPATGIEQDNMGCYGGGLIAVQFRQHPCVGVPTTSKIDSNIENTEAAYFEWLLHEELQGSFKDKGRMDPQWTAILKLGVANLRKRIEALLTGNRIQVSLHDLAQLAEDGGTANLNEFRLRSIYGERSLPLTGLFIDHSIENRKAAIQSWAENLLKIALSFGNIETWSVVNQKTQELWNAFDSQDFRDRFMLSDLEARHKANFPLEQTELDKLDSLRTYFGVSEDESRRYRIHEKLCRDFREYNDLKDDSAQRLIVLFITLNLYLRYAKFIENYNRKNNPSDSVALPPPGEEDLLAALFPVARNPVILYNHMPILKDTEHYKKDAITTFTKDLKRLKLDKYNKNNLDFSKALFSGEKAILKHYAFSIGLKTNYTAFPKWLE